MLCPACGSKLGQRLHENVPDFEHGTPGTATFDLCNSCGLVAQVPTPSSERLRSAYTQAYRAHTGTHAEQAVGARLVAWMTRVRAARIATHVVAKVPSRDARILELGCGSGDLLNALRRRGYLHLRGFDQVTPARRDGIQLETRDLDDKARLGGPFDAIVMVYAIEHSLDPHSLLERCRDALAPGGVIWLLTPNPASYAHNVFGRYWSGLHAPRHPFLFTPRSVAAFAGQLGFRGVSFAYLADPAGWALSLQNWLQPTTLGAAPPPHGTAWYTLAMLPAWYPVALAERWRGDSSGRGQAMAVTLTK